MIYIIDYSLFTVFKCVRFFLYFTKYSAYTRGMSKVIVYSADWCGFCHAVKNYLDQKGVEFEERNVETNPAWGQEAVEKSGQRGIPVVDIDGKIVVGFDRPTIDALLAK